MITKKILAVLCLEFLSLLAFNNLLLPVHRWRRKCLLYKSPLRIFHIHILPIRDSSKNLISCLQLFTSNFNISHFWKYRPHPVHTIPAPSIRFYIPWINRKMFNWSKSVCLHQRFTCTQLDTSKHRREPVAVNFNLQPYSHGILSTAHVITPSNMDLMSWCMRKMQFMRIYKVPFI